MPLGMVLTIVFWFCLFMTLLSLFVYVNSFYFLCGWICSNAWNNLLLYFRSRIRDLAEKQYGKVPTGDSKPNSWTLLDFGECSYLTTKCLLLIQEIWHENPGITVAYRHLYLLLHMIISFSSPQNKLGLCDVQIQADGLALHLWFKILTNQFKWGLISVVSIYDWGWLKLTSKTV